MNNLIVGYGYCGYYLARTLLRKGHAVTVCSRIKPEPSFYYPGIDHHCIDVAVNDQKTFEHKKYNVVYYLIPPLRQGKKDLTLTTFLANARFKTSAMVYFGSTGIYGDHNGQWVTETSDLHLETDRQYRRLDAEQQLRKFCDTNNLHLSLLRIAGIYGPNRIPIEKVLSNIPIIKPNEAPFTNHIFVEDLASIVSMVAEYSTGVEVYNISDGKPHPMGYLQSMLKQQLQRKEPATISFEAFIATASPILREFLCSSKKISHHKLSQLFKETFNYTSLKNGLAQSTKNIECDRTI